MSERVWVIELSDSSVEVSGVAVAFARSRTLFVDAWMEDGDRQRTRLRLSPETATAKGEWAALVPQPKAELHVSYRGEPPSLAAMAWRRKGGLARFDKAVPKEVADRDGQIAAPCKDLWSSERARHETPIVSEEEKGFLGFLSQYSLEDLVVLALRRQAIQSRSRAEEFFFSLDAFTSPGTGGAAMSKAVAPMAYALQTRLDARVQTGVQDLVPMFLPIDASDLFGERAGLQKVADLFEQLTLLYFGVDPGELDWAFEMFATDVLETHHRNFVAHGLLETAGVPNGALFFHFSEFALRCLENGVATAFWSQHLPSVVRAAHVFAEHAVGLKIGKTHPLDEEEFSFTRGRHYPRERLEQLRADYETALTGLTPAEARTLLEDRFTSIVARALEPGTGSPAVATRALTHPVDPLRMGGLTP